MDIPTIVQDLEVSTLTESEKLTYYHYPLIAAIIPQIYLDPLA
jgi:hypothetical protein